MLRRERPVVFLLLVIAIVLIAVGVIYVSVAPPSLPSFFPGHVTRHLKHAYHGKKFWKRGVLAFLLAVIVVGSAWAVSKTRRRITHSH